MSDFTIRQAGPEDAAAMLKYLKQVGGESPNLTFGAEGIPLSLEQEQQFLSSTQSDPRNRMFLVLKNGDIIGNASLAGSSREKLRHRAELSISVKKSYWGRWIGTALIEEVIRWASGQGIELLTLEVLSENSRAISLYERFGFHKFGTLDHFFKTDGKYLSADFMELDLSSFRERTPLEIFRTEEKE